MAHDSSSPATKDPNSHKPEPTTPIPNPNPNPIPNSSPIPPPQQLLSQPQVPTPIYQPYSPSQIPGSLVPNLPPPPAFRPGATQFTQAPNFQNPNSGVPPPGVNPSMAYPGQPPNGMRPLTPMPNGYPAVHPPAS